MPFNSSIEDIIAAGIRINFSNDSALMADLQAADDAFLQPVLGELYDVILDSDDDLYKDLKAICRRAEAALAYWLDLPNISFQITDKGTGTSTNANATALHRWEYEKLLESLADKSCRSMEALLQYLYKNATLVGWIEPDGYKSIFRTARDFSNYIFLFQPYRTFDSLRLIIRTVEDKYIRPLIGDAFFEMLRDNASPDDDTAKAIDLVKKAVAPLAVMHATRTLSVKFTTSGFTVLLQINTDMANQGESNAPQKQLDKEADRLERDGTGYLQDLKSFLNTTASDSVFPDYFASAYYVAPLTEEPESPNATLALFGF